MSVDIATEHYVWGLAAAPGGSRYYTELTGLSTFGYSQSEEAASVGGESGDGGLDGDYRRRRT